MKNLTNLEILETLSINHKKLKEDKPLLFHNILKAMDKAKSQAINYSRCCEELKPKQKCYKSGEPCKYDCSGLCKESC